MRRLAALTFSLVGLAVPSGAAAAMIDDVVAVATKYGGGPLTVRTLAIVSLAMFDAANAVERRYQPYIAPPPPPAGTDAEQAAVGAGCAALAAVRAQQADAIRKDCHAIGGERISDAATASRRYGESIGNAHAEARRNDGIGAPNAWRPATTPEAYVPTTLPVGFDSASARPFALRSPSQFRAAPPPALSSERWARDFNEVRTMGAHDGSLRSAEQTATALFFASQGPQQFLDSIAPLPMAAQGSATDRARYYALVYMALFDASVAVFDTKYTYNFWRPLTAIRNGDHDDNDATPRDPVWTSLIDTPMHPEYPCAHCVNSAAFATVAFSFVGEGQPMVMRSAALPGQPPTTRTFRNARDLAAQVEDARVFGGVHYRNSTEVGTAMGTAVGEHVVATQLRPVAP